MLVCDRCSKVVNYLLEVKIELEEYLHDLPEEDQYCEECIEYLQNKLTKVVEL